MSSNTNNEEFQFQAWRVDEKPEPKQTTASSSSPEGDPKKSVFVGTEQTVASTLLGHNDDDAEDSVCIRVTHSSLNYKDALSSVGTKGVTKQYPHTPGIDAAGYIVNNNSNSGVDQEEEEEEEERKESVLVTGYDLGMNTDGGYGEFIRVPKKWIVSPNPFDIENESNSANANASASASTSARTAMIYGTAGLTAALSVSKLLNNGAGANPNDGKVVVTGASGSVGSVAVEILSNLNFHVVAITGKKSSTSQRKRLLQLGAKEIMGREVLESNKRPLLKPQFAHAVDTVGGRPLVELLKQIQNGGSVTCCGNAAGHKLDDATVFPFILRGVSLLGIDSAEIPLVDKHRMWNNLATIWKCPVTESSAIDIGRHELHHYLSLMLQGQSSGKIVLNHNLTSIANDSDVHAIGNSKL